MFLKAIDDKDTEMRTLRIINERRAQEKVTLTLTTYAHL